MGTINQGASFIKIVPKTLNFNHLKNLFDQQGQDTLSIEHYHLKILLILPFNRKFYLEIYVVQSIERLKNIAVKCANWKYKTALKYRFNCPSLFPKIKHELVNALHLSKFCSFKTLRGL